MLRAVCVTLTDPTEDRGNKQRRQEHVTVTRGNIRPVITLNTPFMMDMQMFPP